MGTAMLYQALIERPVERVVVASSMSIYGEGLYRTVDGEFVEDANRNGAVTTGWDPVDAQGRTLEPVGTPEWKRPALASVYALTKYGPGMPHAERLRRLRHAGRGAAPVQRLRAGPGAVEPVYRPCSRFSPRGC